MPPAEVVNAQRAARLRDSTGLSAEAPLRAVVSRGVPAREAVDANVGAGMRRVDEVSASDVDPDVVEPVEEHEITGLKLVLRNRNGGRVVPLSDGVVRQRDAQLAEHDLHETRAVEAAKGLPRPIRMGYRGTATRSSLEALREPRHRVIHAADIVSQ